MKEKKTEDKNLQNFFKEMSYELAGDIGAIDNEDMKNNKLLNHEESDCNKNIKKKK